MKFKINIVVCGKFHYHRYARLLYESGYLKKIYFSHKLNTTMGVPADARVNLFAKEYLLNVHIKSLGERFLKKSMRFYHKIWQFSAVRNFTPADINIFLIHGNCIELIKAAKRANKIVVGEAVNAHPTVQAQLLADEAGRLGMPFELNENARNKMLAEFELCDIILVPSHAVEESFIKMGYSRDRIVRIPYGMDRKERSSESKETRRIDPARYRNPRVVCVGQVTLRKGQYHLIKAAQILRERNPGCAPEITLIGRCDPKYMDLLKSIDYPFSHIQHIPNSEIHSILQTFDIFALPGIEDGFGVAVLEAMQAGLPVVTARAVGASDVVREYGGGEVIEYADGEMLADAIERVMKASERPNRKAVFGWDEYAESLIIALSAARPSRGTSDLSAADKKRAATLGCDANAE